MNERNDDSKDREERYEHHFVVERLLIPMVSALLTWYIVHLFFHEVMEGPLPDVVTHPFVEVIAEAVVPAGYFTITQFGLGWLAISICIGSFFAFLLWLPGASVPAMTIYGVLGGLTWGGAALLLFGFLKRVWSEARAVPEIKPNTYPGSSNTDDWYGGGTGHNFSEDNMDEDGNLSFSLTDEEREEWGQELGKVLFEIGLYIILCLLGTILVGVITWKYFDASLLQSLIALSVAAGLAIGAPIITYTVTNSIPHISPNR